MLKIGHPGLSNYISSVCSKEAGNHQKVQWENSFFPRCSGGYSCFMTELVAQVSNHTGIPSSAPESDPITFGFRKIFLVLDVTDGGNS